MYMTAAYIVSVALIAAWVRYGPPRVHAYTIVPV